MMIAYVTLGTRDLARAAAFYDTVLAEIGGKRMMEEPDYYIAWGNSPTGAGLGITWPFDKRAASVGNGTMVALQADSRQQVIASTPRRSSSAARTKAHRASVSMASMPPTFAT